MILSPSHITLLTVFTAVFTASLQVEGANILAPIWFSGPSHLVMFRPLFKELAARGHNITVISHHPLKKPVENYTDISIKGSVMDIESNLTMDIVEWVRLPVLGPFIIKHMNRMHCADSLLLPQVQELLNSGQNFDLVISEYFHIDCMAVLADKYKVPLVGITSSMALPSINARMGNPVNPAYAEQYDLPLRAPFSFWGRLQSTLMHCYILALDWWLTSGHIDTRIREALGDGLAPLDQVLHNTSLVLVNSHWSVDQPVPTVPGFVQVGGLHLEKPKPLPQDFETLINESPQDVIYFSLGSMVRCDSIRPERLKAIIDVFASLPQRILWKVDPTGLPHLPTNVRARKWMPQNDILNHPRVRLFITHGGLLGTQEALMAGVPMIVIPLFADQFVNAAKVEATGNGIRLLYEDITNDSLRAAIDKVINNTRYAEKAKQLSALFLDRPRPPLEEAVYWVEYVLRHRGAEHLRSAALDLAWYQYLLLDVAALVLGVLSLGVLFLYVVLRVVRGYIARVCITQKKDKLS